MEDSREGCRLAVLILMPRNQQAAKGVTLLAGMTILTAKAETVLLTHSGGKHRVMETWDPPGA